MFRPKSLSSSSIEIINFHNNTSLESGVKNKPPVKNATLCKQSFKSPIPHHVTRLLGGSPTGHSSSLRLLVVHVSARNARTAGKRYHRARSARERERSRARLRGEGPVWLWWRWCFHQRRNYGCYPRAGGGGDGDGDLDCGGDGLSCRAAVGWAAC